MSTFDWHNQSLVYRALIALQQSMWYIFFISFDHIFALTLFLILFLIVSMTPALSLSHSFSVVLRSSQAVCIFSSSNVIMAFCNCNAAKRAQNWPLVQWCIFARIYIVDFFHREKSKLELAYKQNHLVIREKECYVMALKRTKGSFCVKMNGGTQWHLCCCVFGCGKMLQNQKIFAVMLLKPV